VYRKVVVCLAMAAALWAAEPKAAQLYAEAIRAERTGQVVRAYLLYAEAAALDPTEPRYWARSQALRTRAVLKASSFPVPERKPAAGPAPESTAAAPPSSVGSVITEDELLEVRRLKPPPALKATPGTKVLDLRGNSRSLFEQAAKAFGLDTVFDGDYRAGRSQHLHLDDVDYRQALRALEAATGSFVFPLGERLVMVVKDTPQKRVENEPTMAVTIDIPETVSVQDVQEVARSTQQAMDILRLAVDANRRQVLIKDRVSRVRPAQELFAQLARSRPQVMIEMKFLEVDRSNSLAYGLLMPTQFPLTYFGSGLSNLSAVSLARFFAGHTTIGLGIANAQLFATMNRSYSKTLIQSDVLALDGTAATFHIGQKYPIMTGSLVTTGTSTTTTSNGSVYAPSFNFEDLGLALKVTPHVHAMEEVSLDVEAEFKVLAGSSLNGIPIISNRKLQSKVRVRNGEWGVIGGMMSTSEARAITGLPGISSLPGIGAALRKNTRDDSGTEVLVIMRPVLLNVPADQFVSRTLWVGSEMRLEIPL
jgi:general secretion pathway protein D